MQKWTKTAGLLFMAASSVYYGQAVVAAPVKSGNSAGGAKSPTGTDVRLIEELAPNTVKGQPAPAAKPGAPAADEHAADPQAPRNEGKSVSKSEVNVSDEGTVEIHVNDASLVEVLRMLSLQSQKNIVCSKEVRGTVTANLYNVTIREALDQILKMNAYAYREKGNFINVYTVKELQQIEDAEKRVTTEVFRLYYTPAANALTMIKPVLSPSGQAAATTPAPSGISSGGADAGGNSHAVEDMLVITDFPDNLDKIRKILKDVDRRPQQVLVEATILRAALTEDNALGVDFNVLAGVKFTDITGQSGQITNASSKGGITGNAAGSIGTGNSFSSAVPGGLKVGFVSDNVSVFLSALEGVTDTVVMANPKILALNKQKGEVIVGRKDGYLTTTVTESATVQTVDFLDTGTRLIFRPYIADDGFVRMELHPEDSSGGLTGANLPFKITTELTSNIMVKDGHTIVIGGLFREASDTARSQTPFLGNLPVAGALFRNQRDRTTREEIIIMLTPHVIKDDAVYAQTSAEELKRMERLRVGVRKGLMPWGRERLAEGAYDKALAELNKANPDNQKALWHLDCATNLNPKFLEAIELKQKVSGREIGAVDNSAIRGFVKEMVLADRAAAAATPPAQKTEDKAPAKSNNSPTASKDDAAVKDAVAADKSKPEADPLEEFADDNWLLEDWQQPEADQVVKTDKSAVAATAPATRPSTPAVAAKPQPKATKSNDSVAPGVTVTELPTEEVNPVAPPADENK